ncbi:MAG: Holliday junction branch migration protein RuvA [Alphaproteobacteria bacterium]|jgi:Holliday junction DNA helicase RuvA|nr:Holliday junction branch migration protein RuvA [Alphaproteobacteria bacterium]
MIAKLKGRVDTLKESFLILDVQGVGYLVHASRETLSQMQGGSAATLWIETVMKAEQLVLYGFATELEKSCFNLLVTVQGVGGRMGLALLSIGNTPRLLQAIGAQDATFLTQADGVGPKLANRIVQELKGKVHKLGIVDGGNSPSEPPVQQEALSALLNLGYRRTEALQTLEAIEKETPGESLEALIGRALKALALTTKALS